ASLLGGGRAGEPRSAAARRADGTEFPVEITVAPFERAGRSREVAILRDVTVRRKTLQRLEVLSRAVEQSPVSVVITDPSGAIQYVNPRFTRTTGYAAEEVLGRNPRILKSGEHDASFYGELWRTITAGGEWRGRIRNRTKDGRVVEEEVHISPVKDGSGRITHFVGIKEDVTARRRLEERLERSRRIEAVGRLAGGVAHDLNNLLTVISGFAEMTRSRVREEEPVRTYLGEILEATGRAAELSRKLLAFGSRQVLRPETRDLAAAAAAMRESLQATLGPGVRLLLKAPPAPVRASVDAVLLGDSLLALAANSRDAMEGKGTVEVSVGAAVARPDPDGGPEDPPPVPFAVLSFRDDGPGMSEEARSRLFEPYAPSGPRGRRTGMGLAFVHAFVRQSGGFVEADSSPGGGTVVRLHFPLAAEDQGAPAPPAEEGREVGGGETVLVVDDEPAVASLAGGILEEAGFRVLTATDLPSAERACRGLRIPLRLLLTDVILPGADGKKVAAAVRALQPRTRVLFMSGYAEDVVAHHGVLEPGVRLLSKPFHPLSLCRAVREALDAPAGSPGAPAVPLPSGAAGS
ncbi:MAG: PAS domain S-box protein, partial [Planctomycetaceae bacterium]|nr:PAS domain S-box protein [Planctomycetaceae bacterium]